MASLPRGKSCSNKDHVTPKECCALTIAALDTHLTIPIRGKLEQKEIFQTLIGMASIGQSIHSISQSVRGGVCETSLRHHLRKLEIEDLERANTAILAFYIDQVLKRGESYQFAIDYTHDPYYGTTTSANEDFVIHSKRKKSTNDFYSYVTLYVITKDRQLTLAVYPHRHGISKVGYIARCLDQIAELGLGIEALCLDREFYTRRVIEFLSTVHVPFIIPVKKHGKRLKELLKGTKSRYVEYSMRGKPTVNLTIAITAKYKKGKRGKHGVDNLGYVVNRRSWTPARVHQVYRSRFSIESSYRMRNQAKPRTCSKNPVIRYLYALISFLLKNIWVVLLWSRFSPVKQGPRTIDMRVFRFERFLIFIWDHIRQTFRLVTGIPAFRVPL